MRPKQPPDGRRTVSRSQAVLLAGYGIRLSLALAVTSILGRALSPDAFGFFALIGTTFFLAHVLIDFGTGTIIVREVAARPEREQPLLESAISFRRLCGGVLSLVILIWALVETDPTRRTVLVAVAVVLPLMAPEALMSVFRLRQEQEGPELIRLLGQVFVLAGSLVFLALRLPGALFGLLLALRTWINTTAIGWLGERRLGYRLRAGLRGRGFRRVLSMAAIQAGVGLAQMAYLHGDIFLVLWMRGQEELGAYASAFRPIGPLIALPSMLMLPVLPVLSSLARSGRERLVRHVRRAAAVLVSIAGLAAAAGATLAPDLIDLLYGGRYLDGALNAAPALAWLSIGFGIVLSTSVFNTALLACRGERLLLRFAVIGLAINIAGNLVLLPVFGFTAAALVTAATHALVGAAALVALVRTAGATLLSPYQLLALAPGALLAVVVWQIDGKPVQRVAVGCAIGVIGVLVTLALPGSRRLRADLASETEFLDYAEID